ncbi:MAG: TOBE domain-containing protein [Terrimesophilobacter sp.]
MTHYRIIDAARLLGVSDDTVRRWIAACTLTAHEDDAGRQVIAGVDLAQRAQEIAVAPIDPSGLGSSARNRMVGLVTGIVSDTVMSQVELQCGPHRIVSLMSTEAVRDLGLGIGSRAVAVVKATMVIVETPKEAEK